MFMSGELKGRKIAILATDGFEQVELTDPKKNVEAAGATTEVLSVKEGSNGNASIRGWNFTDWGDSVRVDKQVSKANVDDYDALILPGGQINPDKLRMEKPAVDFVRKFVESGKPVAAICHGPWMLVEAGVVKGKTVTSWPSIHTDLINAGAKWVDKEVVEDGNLITSRKPDDIPAFSKKLTEVVAKSPQHAHAH
jgi:protease I